MFEEAPADRIKMIVASESFCKSKEGAALLKGKKFDVVSDSIFETLSDTKTPQGILAVVKQQPYSFEETVGKEKHHFAYLRSFTGSGKFRNNHAWQLRQQE